jgi:hypothetical protein
MASTRPGRGVFRTRLAHHVAEEAIRFSDLVKRCTKAVGIRSCDRCDRRAHTFNRAL